MKLHEALSTGLPIITKHGLDAVAEDDDWQVRLPDGGVTDEYQFAVAAKAILEKRAETSNKAGIEAWLPECKHNGCGVMPEPFADYCSYHIKLMIPEIGMKWELVKLCECGSEAIGGGSHSSYCPKFE